MDSLKDGYAVRKFAGETKRYCQTLDLRAHSELVAEYRRLHSREGVWPEILQGIRDSGVLEMEIYLRGTRLFMVVELPAEADWDSVMECMARQPRQKEWEALTAKYQEAQAGAKSDEKWRLMERIFHLY